ncbi:phosphate acetyltransferase [Candidatus Woesearchaeota archaeon]|nr:phosphate acetyltransferase [Candidatus Woesearchaeota archaeon]
MGFLECVFATAKKKDATIILAEAEDTRVLEAAKIIERKDLADLILLGDPKKINSMLKRKNIKLKAKILDYDSYPRSEHLAKELVLLRQRKGMTLPMARKLLKTNTKYLAAMMVKKGVADGYVGGNLCASAETMRPALQLIGTKRGFASSFFIMIYKKQPLVFADCAMNMEPTAEELAEIGVQSAKSAQKFGIKPKVAFLSFSTHGSAKHPSVERVRKATQLAKKRLRGIPVDGEIQFDAAWVPDVAKRKVPDSPLKGRATVFIFPNLDSGNIAYKIGQRMAGEEAIGPLIQGLKKPVNDLSRGCSVNDIVDVVAITASSK